MFRRNDRQPVRLPARARDLGHVFGRRYADRRCQPTRSFTDRGLKAMPDAFRIAKQLLRAGHIQEGLVEAQGLDLRRKVGEHLHDRRGDLLIAIEPGWDDHRVWAQPPRLSHRHGAANAVGARLVAGRQHDPSGALRADEQRPASQSGIVELLNRRVERIHIGVSNDSWPNPLLANHCWSLDQR